MADNRQRRRNRQYSGRRGNTSYKRDRRQVMAIRIITILIAVALIAGLVLSVVSCNKKSRDDTDENTTATEETTKADDADKTSRVSIAGVGDIIAHDTVLELAATDTGYDFTGMFSRLKNDISGVDIAICNVETPLGGGPYTGYPNFNTPDEMGLAVIDAGFDVALAASNHSMDAGTAGIRHGIGFWKEHASEILMTGLNESYEEQNEIRTIERNGITFAVLNYTYGLNGYELPADESYLLTLLNDENRDFIRSQIQRADEIADFVIVCPHWGEENQVGEPTQFQRDWAWLFTDAGADLIFGTHPHVIENIEWVTTENGNRALCYYSVGNFLSNQQYTDLVLGAMAYLEVEKDDGGCRIAEGSEKAIPVVTHNDKTGPRTVIEAYYLADYTPELAAVHDTFLTYDSAFSVELLKQKANDVLGSYVMDRLP